MSTLKVIFEVLKDKDVIAASKMPSKTYGQRKARMLAHYEAIILAEARIIKRERAKRANARN